MSAVSNLVGAARRFVRGGGAGRRELLPMVGLVLAEGGARGLSFLFYVLAARELAPHDFGVVRYTITLSTFASVLIAILSVAVTRDMGSARGDSGRTADILGSTLAATAALWLATLGAAIAAGAAGLTGSASVLGLCSTLTGYTAFMLYYAVARGGGQVGRAAGSYLGASAVQLVAFLLLVELTSPDPTEALLVFGLSSVIPVVVWETVSPVLRGRRLTPSRDGLRRLWAIAAPLLAAQVFYIVWQSADQIWVENSLGVREVGIYGTARNLAQIFFILPAGVSGVLLPRVAQLRAAGATADARRLIRNATLGLVGASVIAGLPVALAASPLLRLIYGEAYGAAGPALVILVVGFVMNAGFVGITTAAVGWGRPGLFTLGMVVAAVGETALLLGLAGDDSTTAAWAFSGSIALGSGAVLVRLVFRPFRAEGHQA